MYMAYNFWTYLGAYTTLVVGMLFLNFHVHTWGFYKHFLVIIETNPSLWHKMKYLNHIDMYRFSKAQHIRRDW
jgi:hypothetical protein